MMHSTAQKIPSLFNTETVSHFGRNPQPTCFPSQLFANDFCHFDGSFISLLLYWIKLHTSGIFHSLQFWIIPHADYVWMG
mgnify:CR=1 FL=1